MKFAIYYFYSLGKLIKNNDKWKEKKCGKT
jgi:hypothetical protein